jgi:hypothetical protein
MYRVGIWDVYQAGLISEQREQRRVVGYFETIFGIILG